MRTKLSTKGQLIIPKEVRERMGWRAGTELDVEERGAEVILRPPVVATASSLDGLRGCSGYRGPRRTLAEMEAAVRRGARR
jgi:AbrB family looped-hinge helix DNA binding protein